MRKYIMGGLDVHDESILVMVAVGRGKAQTRSFRNHRAGRRALLAWLGRLAATAGGAGVVVAYEASGQGFGLHDEVTAMGFECHVLAPTRIAASAQQRRRKTDEQDAARLLDLVRAHVLAGNALPTVWVPDGQTRDDREIVRARLDVSEKLTALKAQVQTLRKRNGLARPDRLGRGWTGAYRAWLRAQTGPYSSLAPGARGALGTLLRQMEVLKAEREALDAEVAALAGRRRYACPATQLQDFKGVGQLTAMVFLTELGDLSRFANGRQVGAFLGLAPSSHESGAGDEHKGHITHQGPWRVRRVLCQAAWSRVRTDPEAARAYQRIAARNPKHKKIAVVASMRRLAVCLWHRGRQAQEQAGVFGPDAVSAVA